MDDIIWITYKGRRIPIKPGMKGKFDKKKLNNKLSLNDKAKLKKIGKLIQEDKETGNTANRMKAIEDQERYDRLYDRYKEEGMNEEKIKDRLGERPKTGLEDEELNKIQKEKQPTKMSKSEAEIDRRIKSGEIKIDYQDTPRKYVEVIDEHFGNYYKAGNEDTYRQWTEEQNIKTEKPRVQYNTVSDYEQYFIGLGYSKATALKRAKEIIAERKRK